PEHKIKLPDVFPERVKLSDVTLIVRNRPHDFNLEHLDLDLDPRYPGVLSVGRLQLVGGQIWEKVTARTSYADRKLVLRDVILANDEQFHSVLIDSSQIAARKMVIAFDYVAGGGKVTGSLDLKEAQSTLDTKVEI